MPVKPIPEGFHTVTPYLVVNGVAKLVEFLQKAFNAQMIHPMMTAPDGRVMHAEVKIGDSPIMLGEPMGPQQPPVPAMLYLYVPDVDALFKQAIAAGGTSIMEPTNQFYGDRNAGLKDAFGNQWWIGT